MKAPPWLLDGPGADRPGRRVELDGTEARHATSALRLRDGDAVVVTDGAGLVAEGRLIVVGRGRAEVEITAARRQARSASGITLAMAVLAGSAMDLVVRMAVELGVDELYPVCCARSQQGVDRAATRVEHWRRVGMQALKQCRRAWAMTVAEPVVLPELAAGALTSEVLVADPEGAHPTSIVPGRRRCLLIGPEGGFDDDELAMVEKAGWPKVRLGPHVLRAETAAISGIAVLRGCFDDSGEPNDG